MRVRRISRRAFLRGAGVSLALPLLDAMRPAGLAGLRWDRLAADRRRMVLINVTFGLHAEFFDPQGAGRDYRLSPYLEVIGDYRGDFSVITGVSHPEVDGGHFADASFLTAARHPSSSSFQNTISLDQVAAEKIGDQTRHAYLTLSTGRGSIASSRSGVEIPGETSPSKVFARLFLGGGQDEVRRQLAALRDGRSVMDTVAERARRLESRVSTSDRAKLDEYFTAVRETEKRLAKAQSWATKPKPQVAVDAPQDIPLRPDVIGRVRLMYDLVHLALQTDSTRVVTLKAAGENSRPPIKGVKLDYHGLTHHGKDPTKIAQLRLIEMEHMKAFADFLKKMRSSTEPGGTLLDHSMVLFGSTLGNGSSHDNKNMPIVLAGGGFEHGQHLAFDRDKNEPLCNLFVTMLQHLGLEIDEFGSSTGTLRGL